MFSTRLVAHTVFGVFYLLGRHLLYLGGYLFVQVHEFTLVCWPLWRAIFSSTVLVSGRMDDADPVRVYLFLFLVSFVLMHMLDPRTVKLALSTDFLF